MDLIKDFLVPAGAGLAALLSIWNFFQSPSKKNADEITSLGSNLRSELKEVDDKVDSVGGRVSTLETIMRSMPDKDSMHRLEIGLEQMNGELKALNERLKPIDNLSRRLQDVLLERSNER